MKRPVSARRPLFLDPDRYRRRRLMDAARMLPVLGAFLFLLPVLWRPETSGHSTAVEGVYLFAVWGLLILCARLFAPGLASGEVMVEDPKPDRDDDPVPSALSAEPIDELLPDPDQPSGLDPRRSWDGKDGA